MKKHKPLPSLHQFFTHLAKNLVLGILLIACALWIGMLGYHYLEHLSWIDAFLNASMILAGMGPVDPIISNSGKIFAGCYAIYSGIAFLSTVAVIFTPLIHRFLHQLHVPDEEKE